MQIKLFRCYKCKKPKSLDLFTKNKTKLGGHDTTCKKCNRKASKRYRKNNPEVSRVVQRRSYDKNKEKRKAYNRRVYRENKEEKLAYNREYYRKNKPDILAQKREYSSRKSKDPLWILSRRLRSRLNSAVRGSYKNGSAVKDLGCSIEFFKQYLESKFQPGMTWKNYGRNGWHIDHIVPLKNFDLTKKSNVKNACHYTNLQPMWAIDNLKKSSRLVA